MNSRGSMDPDGMLNGAMMKLRSVQANSRKSSSVFQLPLDSLPAGAVVVAIVPLLEVAGFKVKRCTCVRVAFAPRATM